MTKETSLDMDSQTFTELGYRVIDSMANWLQHESTNPVLAPATGIGLEQSLDEALPHAPSAAHRVLEEFETKIMPYCRRNGHPRFFAYVMASADPVAILADALASALNQNITAWRSAPAAATVERIVIRWLSDWLGFAGSGHGILLSGGSAANLNAISCALARALEHTPGTSREQLTLYVSKEGHLSMVKAGRLLGLEPSHIRVISIDAERRLNTVALAECIETDQAAGLVPFCVCASAGTANSGAVDPLSDIAAICSQHKLWLHIDGAYGAPAAATASYRYMQAAFAEADSLSLDPHKWLFAPVDVACLLLRREEDSKRAYAMSSEYIEVSQQQPLESYAFFDNGMELSRRFRALKIWMAFKVHGSDKLAATIEHNIYLRQLLDRAIDECSTLERLASGLSISCFRYRPNCDDEDQINRFNQRLLEELLAGQEVLMSPTTLDGRFGLRVCIVNFRTTEADIEWLVERVLRIGKDLERDLR